MAPQTLEARVARLEQQVSQLMAARADQSQPAADDWKQTVGMFRGDPVFQEMVDDSRRVREEERRDATVEEPL